MPSGSWMQTKAAFFSLILVMAFSISMSYNGMINHVIFLYCCFIYFPMDAFHTKFIANFQQYRSKHFDPLARSLRRAGISANMLTLCSLITGALAVSWLFLNHGLFVLFAVLHLLFDGLDGVVARISGASHF